MLGHIPFYHETIRRCVVVFATIFNEITIQKRGAGDTNTAPVIEQVKVPLAYGPKEKFLARLEADPAINRPVAITLPRMGFELTAMQYDPSRKLKTTGKRWANTSYVFNPVPYNLYFQLSVMTKGTDDGSQILEQILPFFTPEFTNRVQLVDETGEKANIPLVLTSVSSEDTYQGGFMERRALIWTLNFTMYSEFFGPVNNSNSIIKIINVGVYANTDVVNTPVAENINVVPGLTANGQPTANAKASIAPTLINIDDDWTYAVTITDNYKNG